MQPGMHLHGPRCWLNCASVETINGQLTLFEVHQHNCGSEDFQLGVFLHKVIAWAIYSAKFCVFKYWLFVGNPAGWPELGPSRTIRNPTLENNQRHAIVTVGDFTNELLTKLRHKVSSASQVTVKINKLVIYELAVTSMRTACYSCKISSLIRVRCNTEWTGWPRSRSSCCCWRTNRSQQQRQHLNKIFSSLRHRAMHEQRIG